MIKNKETPKPAKPEKVNLTNKAGAKATPLADDVGAWLKMGWQLEES